MAIAQEITKILHQFKRIHKRQIQPHSGLLSDELAHQLSRKNLGNLNKTQLYILLLKLIREIDAFQVHRDDPHRGLILFRKEIATQAKSIQFDLDTVH